MSAPAPNNRRNYYRLAIFQRITLRVEGVRVPVPATVVDLSGGGCLIHARTMLQPQAAVEFDLARPGQTVLRLAGKLRKVTYTAADRTFRYAVEWNIIDAEIHEALMRFIADEQRRTISGSRRGDDDPSMTSHTAPQTHIQAMRAHRRVEVNFPVRYTLKDVPGAHTATAVDVSTGGLRIITEQVLRQEWVVNLSFTLPSEALRAVHQAKGSQAAPSFGEIRVAARPLPGVKQSRGKYVQSLTWENPDPRATEEITRFVQAMQLTTLGRR